MELGNKVKIRKGMLRGVIVEIQKSMKGRKIFVVQITENVSNGYWEEELELIQMNFKIGDRITYQHSTMYSEGQIHEIYKQKNTALVVLKDGTKYELSLSCCKLA